MPAGTYRHRITLRESTATGRDAAGGEILTWSDVATVWAAVEPISGREYFAAQQVNAETTHRIKMRYRPGVHSKMRVLFGSRTFDIESVIDPEERHVELHLMCVERAVA